MIVHLVHPRDIHVLLPIFSRHHTPSELKHEAIHPYTLFIEIIVEGFKHPIHFLRYLLDLAGNFSGLRTGYELFTRCPNETIVA